MAKVVRVSNSDYKVIVQDGGTITLDTGLETGTVVITGDLEVKGNTTTVESETMTVSDNIITLTAGNTSAGVPAALGYRSGIEVDRGTEVESRLVWDETINWATGGTSGTGTWTFERGSSVIPINTTGIVSGGNLYLIQAGNGVISVTGTNDYEEKVFTYSGGVITDSGSGVVVDDDHIPNAKSVVDYVAYVFGSTFQDKISENDTYVETRDFETTGLPSVAEINVDSISVANFYNNRVEINDVRIQGNEISTFDSNVDLILTAPGTGSVRIDDTLHINSTPTLDDATIDPSAPSDGLRLYAKTEAEGGTGLYFVNSSNTQDEIVSRNRALLFSMIF